MLVIVFMYVSVVMFTTIHLLYLMLYFDRDMCLLSDFTCPPMPFERHERCWDATCRVGVAVIFSPFASPPSSCSRAWESGTRQERFCQPEANGERQPGPDPRGGHPKEAGRVLPQAPGWKCWETQVRDSQNVGLCRGLARQTFDLMRSNKLGSSANDLDVISCWDI